MEDFWLITTAYWTFSRAVLVVPAKQLVEAAVVAWRDAEDQTDHLLALSDLALAVEELITVVSEESSKKT